MDGRALRRVLARVGLIQIDSVNVLARAHEMPVYSRLGPYDVDDVLYRAAFKAPRRLFEYWGHEASFLPVALQPLLRWRMERAADEAWGGIRRIADERPELLRELVAAVAERGPIAAADLQEPRAKTEKWWGWSDTKRALEFLFWSGQITSARRTNGFARMYDMPERVLPRDVFELPTPSEEEAQRELLRISAACLGVAAARDLRDYFRLPADAAAARIAELVEAGELTEVAIEGWKAPAYLAPGARVPRRVNARTLLSPFDPLVWERQRTERLFGFRYRIEIYTPADKREHGYYVLPFLLGDRLVARVDLKADRKAGVLRVPAAFAEPHAPASTADELAVELRRLAGWLGLGSVDVGGGGDLAPALRRAFGG